MQNGGLRNDLLKKIERYAEGYRLRTLDLFSGCGGLSLGFKRAGFEIIAGIEYDDHAADIHTKNILDNLSEDQFEIHSKAIDISSTSPERYMKDVLHAEAPDNLVDVIIGGPPCQAFSRVGRAKLRQIADDENAYLNDDRANLYRDFLGYVRFFSPMVVMMENVPDILNFGGKNVAEEITASLSEIGYRCLYTLLNTANYGVPQSRLRFFLIGFHEITGIIPGFPEPSHYLENPRTLRRRYLHPVCSKKNKQAALFETSPDICYVSSPAPVSDLPPAVNVRDAIGDLPVLTEHLTSKIRRPFAERLPYRIEEHTQYSSDMRGWPGYEALGGGTDGHVVRHLLRDYPIFRRMQCGDEYPAALKIAETIFEEKLEKMRAELGEVISEDGPHVELYQQLKKETVPPYDPKKFTSKWWKLNPELPSRTITAHLGKDTYSHIHYDSTQARVISVREAARLQSFPDGFTFYPSMASAFKQIGNSVPPLMAYAIAMKILALLEKIDRNE